MALGLSMEWVNRAVLGAGRCESTFNVLSAERHSRFRLEESRS